MQTEIEKIFDGNMFGATYELFKSFNDLNQRHWYLENSQ